MFEALFTGALLEDWVAGAAELAGDGEEGIGAVEDDEIHFGLVGLDREQETRRGRLRLEGVGFFVDFDVEKVVG